MARCLCRCLCNKIKGHSFSNERKRWVYPGIFGVLFSACMIFGVQLDLNGNVDLTKLPMWTAMAVLAVWVTVATRYFWDRLFRNVRKMQNGDFTETAVPVQSLCVKRIFCMTGLIFLCWLPVFLAVYPGFFVYDVMEEVNQVVTREFSTHHPLLHVLLLGGVVQAGYKLTGNTISASQYTHCVRCWRWQAFLHGVQNGCGKRDCQRKDRFYCACISEFARCL